MLGYLERVVSDLPHPDAALAEAFRRQGLREMLETLIDWEPDSVREERRLKEEADAN